MGLYVELELILTFFEFLFLPDDKLVEYDKPVPGADILALAPVLELNETPPCLPPTLTPTLFLPIFSFTPGAIFTLFLNLNPKINTP